VGIDERGEFGRAAGPREGALAHSNEERAAFSTQWTGGHTTAAFDYTSATLTNQKTFGSLTDATNSARRVQLAARFTF
jgi:hypothetical protein